MKNIDLSKPSIYRVVFTIEPAHKLVNFTTTNEAAKLAVSEASFIASILENNLSDNHIQTTVRGIAFDCCMSLAKSLENHFADSELIRDIYPYTRLSAEGNHLADIFKEFYSEFLRFYPVEVKADE